MTWDQQQERAYKLEQAKERSRLDEEIRQGQRWGTALECLNEFVTEGRQRVITELENASLFMNGGGDENIKYLAIKLRVLAEFANTANTYIQNKASAERRIFFNDDNDNGNKTTGQSW